MIMCVLIYETEISIVTLSTLGKIFSRRHTEILFPRKKHLFPFETLFLKCQILFSEKNKENIINLLPADLAKGMVKVKYYPVVSPPITF